LSLVRFEHFAERYRVVLIHPGVALFDEGFRGGRSVAALGDEPHMRVGAERTVDGSRICKHENFLQPCG
jgi:hypothetical protein